ncbi:MAG: hypothetical protein NT062_26420, partial [Proteobacteria bacterium]|nr:hypothetical protein [Pseudomonadota bacterium]
MTGSRARACSLAIAIAACGPKPTSAWIEHDSTPSSQIGRSHVEPTARLGTSPPVAIDLTHPDTLDEASLATALAQLGERAPAGVLALRAARLAAHRGGDAEARAYLARAATAADAPGLRAEITTLAKLVASPPVDPAVGIAVLL